MFKSLSEFFANKSVVGNDLDPSKKDIKLAAATLMFEVIRSDGVIGETELQNMRELLRVQFELSATEIEATMQLAEESSDYQTSLQGFTREVCDQWGNEKRLELLEYLWVIALTDGVIDANERHLIRKIAGLLYLTPAQTVLARENAKLILSKESS
jgi:uncharacterized tellurite resistance protein B-like protein